MVLHTAVVFTDPPHCACSVTVQHFLQEVASRGRKFEVVVAESAPALDGHKMAQVLAKVTKNHPTS